MSEAIAVHNLSMSYRDLKAVDKVSFTINKGEFVGLVGPNGSGKTTTLKMLCGLLQPSFGDIELNGIDVTSNAPAALKNVGCVISSPELYGGATPNDILSHVGRLFQMPKNELKSRVDEVLSEVGMLKWKNKRTRTFSKGMKQRIVIAQALINNPEILILDEPVSGLDPIGMNDIYTLLKNLNASGTTILMSSHLLHSVDTLCSRVLMLNHGRLVMEGAPSKLVLREMIRKLSIKTLQTVSEETLEKVKNLSKIVAVSKTADGIEVELNGSFDDQAQLLNSLISWGIRVYSFESSDSLEDIFIDVAGEQ